MSLLLRKYREKLTDVRRGISSVRRSINNDLENVKLGMSLVRRSTNNDLENVEKDVQPEGLFLFIKYGLLILYQLMNS